jgi:hypothetical protein
MSTLAPVFDVLDTLHAAYEHAARDEVTAQSDHARGMAAGRRMAYSHALKLLSQALSEPEPEESPGDDMIDAYRRLKEQHAARYR